MEQKEWFNRFDMLIDETIESLYKETDNITGADIGLILQITEDYLENPDEHTGRDLRTLELSRSVLDISYNVEDISWFDLYEIIVEPNSEVGRRSYSDGEKELDDDLSQLYIKKEFDSKHAEEFDYCTRRLFESITSEEADKLQNSTPYDDSETDEFDHFKYGVRNRVGFNSYRLSPRPQGATQVEDRVAQ